MSTDVAPRRVYHLTDDEITSIISALIYWGNDRRDMPPGGSVEPLELTDTLATILRQQDPDHDSDFDRE